MSSFDSMTISWKLMPEYFLHCVPQNQMVLPEYCLLFAQQMAIKKKNRGGGGCIYSPI